MKYEDFERALELRDEISRLQAIAMILQPDEYAEEEPVTICRKICDVVGSPVSIPANIARDLSSFIWNLVNKKEEEFEAL